MDEISVHDNFVRSYVVNAEKREIVFNTVFRDKPPHETTVITFSGVSAYHLEGDDFKTILFDISEGTIKEIFNNHRQLFLDNKNYCWPIKYESEDELIESMSKQGMRAFLIESSCGMGGWIWAKDISKQMSLIT